MARRCTYILTGSQVAALITMAEAVEAVEEAFRAHGQRQVQLPPKPYLTFKRGDLRAMPAYVPEWGLACVKNVNSHPENADLPTVMATITLFDPETGFPLAIMDGTTITALRTGAAGAVAARHLANPRPRTVGLIGAGRQAEAQVEALMTVFETIEEVLVNDLDPARSEALARTCAERWGLRARPADAPEAAAADVVVTTTPSRRPVVRADWVREGAHINAIGADAPGKQELDLDLLLKARVVVDCWEQASHGGEINTAVRKGLMDRDDLAAELGEVVCGRKAGRTRERDITVFDSTGLAVQDLACARVVWLKLKRNPDRLKDLLCVDFFA